MSKTKEIRNREIVKKKLAGWSYGKLAEHFNLSRPRVLEIWLENKDKFTNVKGVDKSAIDTIVRGSKMKV